MGFTAGYSNHNVAGGFGVYSASVNAKAKIGAYGNRVNDLKTKKK
jgi:hypothetical protein